MIIVDQLGPNAPGSPAGGRGPIPRQRNNDQAGKHLRKRARVARSSAADVRRLLKLVALVMSATLAEISVSSHIECFRWDIRIVLDFALLEIALWIYIPRMPP